MSPEYLLGLSLIIFCELTTDVYAEGKKSLRYKELPKVTPLEMVIYREIEG